MVAPGRRLPRIVDLSRPGNMQRRAKTNLKEVLASEKHGCNARDGMIHGYELIGVPVAEGASDRRVAEQRANRPRFTDSVPGLDQYWKPDSRETCVGKRMPNGTSKTTTSVV
jgi:hypothetical protein